MAVDTSSKNLIQFLIKEDSLYDYLYYRLEDILQESIIRGNQFPIIVDINEAFTWDYTRNPHHWRRLYNKH